LREEERLRIRRDLHDGLGPTLAGIVLGLEQARVRVGTDPAVASSTLAQLSDYAQAAVVDVRRLVHDLRPAALDERGLSAALTEAAGRLGAVVVTDPELPPLTSAVEVAVWRIALEALTNAQRHANASRIEVRLGRVGTDLVELAVTDDGDGLDAAAPPGIGILSMRERAHRVGGTLTVAACSPHGTSVRASLPLAASA
jgi:signal transduction histidine kinase